MLRSLLGAVAVMTLLCGCTVDDRGAARLVDDDFVFLFCKSYSFDRVRVTRTEFGHTTVLWEAVGDALLDAEEVVTYGEPPDGMTTTVRPEPLPQAVVDVSLERLNSNQRVQSSMAARYNIGALEADPWVDQGGWLVQTPCTD